MKNQTLIYADNDVCRWHIIQLGGIPSQDITAELAVYHVPFPYDQGHSEQFESRIDQSIIHSDCIVVLCSELHEKTANFIRRYQNPKIKFFLCGAVEGVESSDWMDWFITSSHFYKTNPVNVLDRLNPYQLKPKFFDILLGQPKEHRTLIYNFAKQFEDQLILTYFKDYQTSIQEYNEKNWIWESEGLEIPPHDFNFTVTPVRYYGESMSLSQVVPISIYNKTAYSVVCETNFDNNYSFFTEKTVKPILGRRLFLLFGGKYQLQNLRQLGFKTFDGIIDESYDLVDSVTDRANLIIDQMKYLMQQDQQIILDKIKPIVEYNYKLMIETDWYGDFSKELRAVLLAHTN